MRINQIAISINYVLVEVSDLLLLVQYIEKQRIDAAKAGETTELKIHLVKSNGTMIAFENSESLATSEHFTRNNVDKLGVGFQNQTTGDSISACLTFSPPKTILGNKIQDNCVVITSNNKNYRKIHYKAIKSIKSSFLKRSYWLTVFEILTLMTIVIPGFAIRDALRPIDDYGYSFFELSSYFVVLLAATFYFSWRRRELHKIFPSIMILDRGKYALSLNELSHLSKTLVFDLGAMFIAALIYGIIKSAAGQG